MTVVQQFFANFAGVRRGAIAEPAAVAGLTGSSVGAGAGFTIGKTAGLKVTNFGREMGNFGGFREFSGNFYGKWYFFGCFNRFGFFRFI